MAQAFEKVEWKSDKREYRRNVLPVSKKPVADYA